MNVNLSERFTWILIGAVIGFILGYGTRYFQTGGFKIHREDGFMRLPSYGDVKLWLAGRWHWLRSVRLKDWALLLVVLIVAFSSFQSQSTSNTVKETQNDQAKVSYCNGVFLGKTITALNERTTFTKKQAKANIDLQKSFQTFLRVLTFQPPKPQEQQEKAFYSYFKSLNLFVTLSEKTSNKQEENPYPTVKEFTTCLTHNLGDIKKELANE